MRVMHQVVFAKGSRNRQPDGQVHQQSEKTVVQRLLEKQVMTQLVDSQKQSLIGETSHRPRDKNNHPPR